MDWDAKMKTLTQPTIHLNGSDGERLQLAYEEAANAVWKARVATSETAPNARDYYVQGPDAFEKARQEHDTRAKALIEVENQLCLLAQAVGAQNDERARK